MTCTKCGISGPDDAFPWKNKANGKRHEHCKECQRAKSRAHYAANRSKYAAMNRDRRDSVRETARLLKEVPCADCGVQYPYYVMDFDHLDGSVKLGNVSRMAATGASLQLKEEAGKCDIVCANCHRERTHQRGSVVQSG